MTLTVQNLKRYELKDLNDNLVLATGNLLEVFEYFRFMGLSEYELEKALFDMHRKETNKAEFGLNGTLMFTNFVNVN